MQLSYPAMGGGPNGRSLMEEQQIFAKRNSSLPLVDPGWRPLDPNSDVYLDWDSEEDHKLLHTHWAEGACQHLYYWREDYWLRALRNPS